MALLVHQHITPVMFFGEQKVQERWYEKLHEWNKALHAYEEKSDQNPDDVSYLLGRMRCLEALGQWSVAVRISITKLHA